MSVCLSVCLPIDPLRGEPLASAQAGSLLPTLFLSLPPHTQPRQHKLTHIHSVAIDSATVASWRFTQMVIITAGSAQRFEID